MENTQKLSTAMTLNVQCWNVTEARLANLPTMIRKYMPDSFGVQEATTKWMDTLKAALPEYDCVGVGREKDLQGEYSAIFYRKDAYHLIRTDTKWLSDTPDVPGSKFEDSSYRRVATYAVLERKCDGARLLHINTHLDNSHMSCKQIAVMLELLKDWNAESLPVLLTGDFNFNPDTPNYQMYLDAGFQNTLLCAKETSEKTDSTPFPRTTLDGYKFDYLFIKAENFEVLRHRVCTETVNGEYISDHYPVYIEFML